VLVLAALLLVLIAGLRWWGWPGFTGPASWQNLRLYWLPVVLLALAFVPAAEGEPRLGPRRRPRTAWRPSSAKCFSSSRRRSFSGTAVRGS
jgi:hypothetical protein